MAHTVYPSSSLCSGGSSDPFFSPLCVPRLPGPGRGPSALSSLRHHFKFPVPTVCHPVDPESSRAEHAGQSSRSCPKASASGSLALSACAREQNKSKQLFYFQQHTNTYFDNSFRIISLQFQGGGIFPTLRSACESQSGTANPGCTLAIFKCPQMNRGPIES
jgi:hypothetical protein